MSVRPKIPSSGGPDERSPEGGAHQIEAPRAEAPPPSDEPMEPVPAAPEGEGTPVDPRDRYVVFRAAGRRFALPLAEVREVVVPPPTFVRVPRSPPAVRGAMNLRGRVVTAVDLSRLWGRGDELLAPATGRLVVLAGPVRDLGILVGEVTGIVPLPAPEPVEGEGGPGAVGVSRPEGEAVTCLSMDGIFAYIASLLPEPR